MKKIICLMLFVVPALVGCNPSNEATVTTTDTEELQNLQNMMDKGRGNYNESMSQGGN